MQKSDSIKNIAKALAAFQSEVKNPTKTTDNPFFKSKYAPLSEILNTVRPLMAKHGLSILQAPSGDGAQISITTLITHESGEWIEADPLILRAEKATAQGAGSAITYGRRYALSSMLGISSEEDDDGNQASNSKSAENGKPATNSKSTTNGNSADSKKKTAGVVTPKMMAKLFATARDAGMTEKMKDIIAEKYGKASSKELTRDEVSELIDYLSTQKSA